MFQTPFPITPAGQTQIAPLANGACPVCPKLPSSDSAYRLCIGDPAAPFLLVRDWLGRSALIGIGMGLAGEREHLIRNSLAGGAAIEAFVLAYIWYTTRQAGR